MTIVAESQITAETLVRRFQAGVWRYLRFLGCDAPLADDLTQDTFLKVIEKPFDYRGDPEAAAYLRTVARNLFLTAMRRQQREPAMLELDLADQLWGEQMADGGDEYLALLEECVAGLQGRSQQVIDLRYRDQEPRDSIAAALGLTANGVKTLLRRTRLALRQCIERKLRHDRSENTR